MGVLAGKILAGVLVTREMECSTFDLLMATNPGDGWVEISRNCDHLPPLRRTLYPFAGGYKSGGAMELAGGLDERLPFRKYFAGPEDDTEQSVLDLSDVNGGFLPANYCAKIWVFQNGKKLPCEAYDIDFEASTLTIKTDWLVPGAAYEILFEAPIMSDIEPGES